MSKQRRRTSEVITWGTAVAGALAIAAVGRDASFPPAEVLLLFTALAVAAEFVHTPLPGAGYQTFGPAVSLPAIALFGPVPAAWLSAVGVLIGDGLLRRRRLPAILFNVGQRILSVLLAGLAWNTLLWGSPTAARVGLPAGGHAVFTAVLVLMSVYVVTATIPVTVFHSVVRVEPFWTGLGSGTMWRLPTALILGAFGLSIAALFMEAGLHTGTEVENLLTLILIVSLVALLYTSRRQHLRDLANVQGAIAAMLERIEWHEVLGALADWAVRLTRPDIVWITVPRDGGSAEVALARTAREDPQVPPPEALPAPLGEWALAHARPRRIADYLHDVPRTSKGSWNSAPHRVRAVLTVPLQAAGEPVAALTLTSPIPGYFSEYHQRVVGVLAAKVAPIVRNAQLYATAKLTVARFEALQAISDRINAQQNLEGVIDLIAESAREILAADRFVLYLGEAGKEITHTFARNQPPEHLERATAKIRHSDGFVSLAMLSKKPMVAADAQVDVRTDHEMARLAGYRTIAAFPLGYRDATIGALALYHDTVRPYGSADVALGMAFANQVAAAVQNLRRHEEAEDEAHRLTLLNRAFTRVAISLSPRDLFETLVEELHTTFNYALVSIRLVEGDHLRFMAHRGYTTVTEMSPIGTGIAGRVARTGRAAFVADVSADPDYVAADERVTQVLCVPVLNQGGVAGVIDVEAIEPRLAQRDVELLSTLAGYAAVALEKAQLYEQTQALATTDGLTGLLNYRSFWQALEQELARSMRYGLPLSLIMIEIDKFKRYNDTYGHLRGDEVIRLVARVLRQEHRAQVDIVARYGGDEFMILLPHTQKVTAVDIAERVRRAVEATPLISETSVASVTLSLGVASYPEDGKSTDTLIEAADRSMYQAKTRGGNAVEVARSL